jgi:microcystin-dependent protein
MSRNGSGTYSLPAGNPVTPNTTITSTWANTTLSDIATALTGSIAADGQTPVTGTLNMTSNLISNLADPVSAQDATTKNYVDTADAVLTADVAALQTEIDAINSIPTGALNMWPTASAPTGWLICNGSAVSRTTYATLFGIIGTTYGTGDGSTTFNLPNLQGKMPIGVSGSYTLASTGGSADAVLVSHTHTASVTDPGHNHTANGADRAGGYAAGSDAIDRVDQTTSTSTTGISVTNSTEGVSGTGANLPPYLAINFIIKH